MCPDIYGRGPHLVGVFGNLCGHGWLKKKNTCSQRRRGPGWTDHFDEASTSRLWPCWRDCDRSAARADEGTICISVCIRRNVPAAVGLDQRRCTHVDLQPVCRWEAAPRLRIRVFTNPCIFFFLPVHVGDGKIVEEKPKLNRVIRQMEIWLLLNQPHCFSPNRSAAGLV